MVTLFDYTEPALYSQKVLPDPDQLQSFSNLDITMCSSYSVLNIIIVLRTTVVLLLVATLNKGRKCIYFSLSPKATPLMWPQFLGK